MIFLLAALHGDLPSIKTDYDRFRLVFEEKDILLGQSITPAVLRYAGYVNILMKLLK
jgi:hypothetical protein